MKKWQLFVYTNLLKLEKLKNRKKTQLPDLNVDKILSPTELLDQKLKSGEITKYCI